MDTNLFLFLAQTDAPSALSLSIPFSVLHFLEFAIWGAWYVVLGNYLNSLNFSRKDIGNIYSTIWIGSIISPMFVGAIADRYFNTEVVLAVSHLLGAILLYFMAQIKRPKPFFWVSLLYALVYAPTIALVFSIVFAHLDQSYLPGIRVWGSIGWIIVGLSLKFIVKSGEAVNNRPLLLAAALSAVLGVFCFFLPATPPQGGTAFPFSDAVALLKEPKFAVFFGSVFLVSLTLSVYFSFTALFLEQHGKVRPENVGPIMTIGQWAEVIVMLMMAWFIGLLGMKWVLALGALAWGLRYLLFAVGRPLGVLILGVALHGICYNFIFLAGPMYVDAATPEAIRNSAQSLFLWVTYGIGMTIGALASGWLNEILTKEVTDPETGEVVKMTDWKTFWLVPCGIVVVSFVLLAIFLRV